MIFFIQKGISCEHLHPRIDRQTIPIIYYHYTTFIIFNSPLFIIVLSLTFEINSQAMNKVQPAPEDELSVYHLVRNHKSIRIQKQEQRVNGPSEQIICKICLEGYISSDEQGHSLGEDEMQENQLIVPCQCSGSMGYVHHKCIKLWVQKQLENNHGKRAYCQICKEEIFFKIIKLKTCSCKLQNNCQASICNFICLLVESILLAVVSIFYYYLNNITTIEVVRYFTVALILILSLTLTLTIFLILKENYLKTTKAIHKIYSVRECEQLGYKQVKYPDMIVDAEELLRRIKILQKQRRNELVRKQAKKTPVRFSSIDPANNMILS